MGDGEMANTLSRIIDDDKLNRIVQIESAGNPNAKAPTSSAAGLGQFITATWLATVRKHKPALLKTKSEAEVANMRRGVTTAALQLEMLARFTEDNARALGPNWVDGDLYLAHFLGIGAAAKLLRAAPSTLVSNLVSYEAIKANRSILEGKNAGAVRAWAHDSMIKRWDKAGRPNWVAKWHSSIPQLLPPDIPTPVAPPPPKPPDAPKPKPPPPPPPKKRPTVTETVVVTTTTTVGGGAASYWSEHTTAIIIGTIVVVAAVIGGFVLIRRSRKG